MQKIHHWDMKEFSLVSAGRRYQLDIDISTLSFTHHPLFSTEHVLVSKLHQLYNQYCMKVRRGLVEHLSGKV